MLHGSFDVYTTLPEALARILHQIKYSVYFTSMSNFILKLCLTASDVQTRNPFSHTVYVKITRVNYVKETPKFVLRPLNDPLKSQKYVLCLLRLESVSLNVSTFATG